VPADNEMSSAPSGTKWDSTGRRQYAFNVQAKTPSTNCCSFCWFILTAYPSLDGMTPRDDATFKAHLLKSHGWQEDILA